MRTLVTGATAGIGLETARALAERGHAVWIHGRTRARAMEAIDAIRDTVPGADLKPVAADLASLAEVRALATEVATLPLDVLVNNAGVFARRPTVSADGFETTWAVNHLAPFLLTSLLLDGLLRRPDARVVNVSSVGHRSGRFHFDDPGRAESYDGIAAYCRSKLANVMFTRELARRTRGTSLVTHALHPGVIQTKLLASTGFGNQPTRSAADGAATSVFLAADPAARTSSGDYFVDSRRVRALPTDPAADRRLWEISATQTGAQWPPA